MVAIFGSATLSGSCVDLLRDGDVTTRQTFKILDENTQLRAMYGAGPDGKEFKTPEVKMMRKK